MGFWVWGAESAPRESMGIWGFALLQGEFARYRHSSLWKHRSIAEELVTPQVGIAVYLLVWTLFG